MNTDKKKKGFVGVYLRSSAATFLHTFRGVV